MTIGERIKQRRKELGINAEALGKMLGIDRSTVFRYENGSIGKIPVDFVKTVANLLHTTPEFLMGLEEHSMSIGDRIKAKRIERGWTQEELADRMGYKSKSSINKIELGSNDIPQSKVVKFSEALDCSMEYLLGLDETPKSRNKEVLSKNLKYYIEKSGKDRRELAEIWGFPYSTVSEWINGRKYPRIDHIETMADYFGILKSDLIEERTEEYRETQRNTKNNDIQKDIVEHMQNDDLFYEVVKRIYELDREKLKSLRQLLQ